MVLAVGHSARSMYRRLIQHDVSITPKPFAMGFRIEHPQALIDQLQYGERDALGEPKNARMPVGFGRLCFRGCAGQRPPVHVL